MNPKIARQIFNLIDTDKSGQISVQELHVALSKLNIEADQQTIEDIVQLIDLNNNNSVDFEEFQFFLYICTKSDPDDPLKILFYAADHDQSGTVSRDEMYALFQRINLNFKRVEFEQILNYYNVTGDRVDYNTFNSIIKKICT